MRKNNLLLTCSSVLLYLFLYTPIFVVIIYSFNEGKSTTVWEGFSIRWYYSLLGDFRIQEALLNSLKVSISATCIATILGTSLSLFLFRYDFWGKGFLKGILQLPVVLPDIVLGISTLSFLVLLKVTMGIFSMIFAHVTFCMAFVALIVSSRLANFDTKLEDAARDLGATSFQTFRYVTLPLITPGVVAGALLSYTLSFDDFTVSFFTSGVASTTLPLRIFSMLHFGVTPVVNAVSTLLIFASFILVFAASRLNKDWSRKT